MAEDVTLTVGGKIWGGWKTVEITTSLETVAGGFSLGLTERWPGQQAARAIAPGMACKLAIGGETVITGHVDDVTPSYDNGSHSVEIKGRDATGDLVDCSALAVPGTWSAPLATIAGIVCKPFGIPVTVAVGDCGTPMRKFSLQMGETAWEAIDRLARAYGVLATSDSRGGLVFTRAGQGGAHAECRLGGNILKAKGAFSDKDRYSRYIVLGQVMGNDYLDPSLMTQMHAEATDPGISRYRPLIIMAEAMPDNGINYDHRAKWEASVRAGRSRKATITVQGWRDADGKLYRFNRMVRVEDDFLGLHSSLLISGVKHTISEEGTLAELTVTRREAFDVIPIPFSTNFDAKGA